MQLSNKDMDNLVDQVINRAHKKCLLESSFQSNSDRSINALERLKALGNETAEILFEHESFRSQNDYLLLYKVCIESLSLSLEKE